MQQRGPREVVASFVIGVFALGLLIFTAMVNLELLVSTVPDRQFVGFGLLAFEGGTVVWTALCFLTSKHQVHFGICLIGVGVDTLLSFTGFMYGVAIKTGTTLPVAIPVIYIVGAAVIFNVGAALCYKLVPHVNYTGMRITALEHTEVSESDLPLAPRSLNQDAKLPALPDGTKHVVNAAASLPTQLDTGNTPNGTTAARARGRPKRTT